MLKKYETDDEKGLRVKGTTQRTEPKTKLDELCAKYLINYLEKNLLAVVDQTAYTLCAQLEWFNILKATIHKHIREQRLFPLK